MKKTANKTDFKPVPRAPAPESGVSLSDFLGAAAKLKTAREAGELQKLHTELGKELAQLDAREKMEIQDVAVRFKQEREVLKNRLDLLGAFV